MSKQTDQGIFDFIQSNPPSESDLPYSFTYDNFLTSMESVFKSQRDLTAWQKLNWELIKNRINFKLKAQYIRERLQRSGHLV